MAGADSLLPLIFDESCRPTLELSRMQLRVGSNAGSGHPSGWLALMQELRVEVTRRSDSNEFEHLTDISPVVRAVANYVQKDFLS